MRDAATQPADRQGAIAVAAQANVNAPDAIAALLVGRPGEEYPRLLYHPGGCTRSWLRPSSTNGDDPARRAPAAPDLHHGVLGANNARKSSTSVIWAVASNPC